MFLRSKILGIKKVCMNPPLYSPDLTTPFVFPVGQVKDDIYSTEPTVDNELSPGLLFSHMQLEMGLHS